MGYGNTITEGLHAALNNCTFVSTNNLKDDLAKPFTFLMDASMLGVGAGFDTKGADQIVIKGPAENRHTEGFVILTTKAGRVTANAY